jgi:hypothetical protein
MPARQSPQKKGSIFCQRQAIMTQTNDKFSEIVYIRISSTIQPHTAQIKTRETTCS